MDLAPADEIDLGLFPLPNVVLFPGLPLPLHVFEPRYRALTRDALRGEERIGMILLRPGWEGDYDGRPPVHPIGTVGRIVRSQVFEDGKFDLLLEGEARFLILEERPGGPYRRARVRILAELPAEPGEEATLAAAEAIRDAAEVLHPGALARAAPDEEDPGVLAAMAAELCAVPVETRQEMLTLADPLQRVRVLLATLAPAADRLRSLDRLVDRGGKDRFETN